MTDSLAEAHASSPPRRGPLVARLVGGLALTALGFVAVLAAVVRALAEMLGWVARGAFLGPDMKGSWLTSGPAAALFLAALVGGLALAIHSAYRLGRTRSAS